MSLFLKTIYSTLTGALGALVAWLVLDGLIGGALGFQPVNPYLDAIINGSLVGLCVGVAVNGFAGLMEFKPLPVIKGVAVGFFAGLLGGMIGLLIGEAFYQFLGGGVLLRIVGWAIFGVSIGIADGLLAFSIRRILYAGLGGLLGGALGGAAFSALSLVSNLPNTTRALGFTLVGAFIGLFVGLLPVVLRNAWLKVTSSGRNEGKERLVDKSRVVIGSGANCDLPLYDDPAIAPQHAEISQESGQFVLKPISGVAVLVNDQPVTRHPLQNDDIFRVGRETIIFRKRG